MHKFRPKQKIIIISKSTIKWICLDVRIFHGHPWSIRSDSCNHVAREKFLLKWRILNHQILTKLKNLCVQTLNFHLRKKPFLTNLNWGMMVCTQLELNLLGNARFIGGKTIACEWIISWLTVLIDSYSKGKHIGLLMITLMIAQTEKKFW